MKYLLTIAGILSAVLAQFFIKSASMKEPFSKNWITFLLLSIFSYGVAFLLQVLIFRYFPLSKIAPVMAIAIMTLVFISGIWFFGESIAIKQIVGIIFGIIAIFLILS